MPEIERDYSEQTESNNSISKIMVASCYSLALLLTSSAVYGFTTPLANCLTWAVKKTGIEKFKDFSISELQIISFVAIIFLLYKLTKLIGDHWRSTGDSIGASGLNFPNPFFDNNFKKGPILLQQEYNEVSANLVEAQELLKKSENHKRKLEHNLKLMESKIRVSMRHNNNVNRLLRSFNFLYKNKNENFKSQMLRYVLDECITVLEQDQSDKSISLFKVQNEELKIIESVRINAESIAKRTFQKNVGFAGYIWKEGEPEIINNIENNDKRFSDQGLPVTPIGSILGFPLKVDDEILGVLCLQSEVKDGFSEADLRTVEFYARMCTLVLQYDTMKINKEGI